MNEVLQDLLHAISIIATLLFISGFALVVWDIWNENRKEKKQQ